MERRAHLQPEQAWARATLVAGKAAVQRWTIDGKTSNARLVVGRDPACDWAIDSEGVLPQHLALQWNGELLWLVPVGESFSLVNGALLTEPLCVLRTTWVELGSAVMIVDASGGPPASPSLSQLEAAAQRIDVDVAQGRGTPLSCATYAPTRIYQHKRDVAPPLEAPASLVGPSRAARALSTTVIAPLSQICPELAAHAHPVEVSEPRRGKPPAAEEHRDPRETRTMALGSAPRPFVRGVSVRADLAQALRALERRWVRLLLVLAAALLVIPLVALSQLHIPTAEAGHARARGVRSTGLGRGARSRRAPEGRSRACRAAGFGGARAGGATAVGVGPTCSRARA